MTRLISYEGELVAIAGPRRFFLTPEVEADERQRRFVALMCVHSRDVDAGAVPGPYSEARAQFFARTVLIPDEEFDPGLGDEELAERFAVPVEQIARKGRDPVRATDAG